MSINKIANSKLGCVTWQIKFLNEVSCVKKARVRAAKYRFKLIMKNIKRQRKHGINRNVSKQDLLITPDEFLY